MRILLLLMLLTTRAFSQTGTLTGELRSGEKPVPFASITQRSKGTFSDEEGKFILENIQKGTVLIKAVGYVTLEVSAAPGQDLGIIQMQEDTQQLNEVVITGTMKEVSRMDSPVPVEIFTAKFFKSNPTPSVFDALQNINGVRPQVNCNVCSTGDIHINGLEGPYTMVLIDGMPIVSGLSTVYGLNGIPQSLIERMEVVKGPASTLYGSEAVGGLINIITKSPLKAPLFAADMFATGWGEVNTDLSAKWKMGEKVQSLLGVNYFKYQNPIDKNGDNFTDLTLQDRLSVFNKWSADLGAGKQLNLAGRYLYEDRWGGEMQWTRENRGGDEVYGESIYTKRWEAFGNYKWHPEFNFMFSANGHNQNSVYGNVLYKAQQNIYFGQFTWGKRLGKHDILTGAAYRHTYYDDNTPATFNQGRNVANRVHLPGVFVQDEYLLSPAWSIMGGLRYDYNSVHGSILSPRLNLRWKKDNAVFRLGGGNGFRVANVFTEDHAALTGSREVVFLEDLRPETSWNVNANFVQKLYLEGGTYLNLDATAFYTYFTNKIIPDYDTDAQKIIYDNLDGHSVSRGVSLNVDVVFPQGFKALVGGTLMDVYVKEQGEKSRQMFTERFTMTWSLGYTFPKGGWNVDYTGNLFGPMRLPLLGELDPRPEYSPTWSIQNIQVTKPIGKSWEVYGGVKNLLNWTPAKSVPFLIARAHDPFDKQVSFSPEGAPLPTENNPYALTFDPSYVYASNQGIRGFLGVRFTVK